MASGAPDYSAKVISSGSEEEQKVASVTASETVVTFSNVVKSFVLYNDGANAVHFSLTTGVDTDNFKIPSGAGFMLDVPTTKIYLICDTAETASVYVVGVR